jgi:hypothetical protein
MLEVESKKKAVPRRPNRNPGTWHDVFVCSTLHRRWRSRCYPAPSKACASILMPEIFL